MDPYLANSRASLLILLVLVNTREPVALALVLVFQPGIDSHHGRYAACATMFFSRLLTPDARRPL